MSYLLKFWLAKVHIVREEIVLVTVTEQNTQALKAQVVGQQRFALVNHVGIAALRRHCLADFDRLQDLLLDGGELLGSCELLELQRDYDRQKMKNLLVDL